jgi:hypothetical protein
MIDSSVRAIVFASALATFSASLVGSAYAGPYDGSWSVTVTTSRGNCGSYRYGVNISNGIVSGGGGGSVSGRVSNRGGVSVSVSGGPGTAYGSGHLSRNSGGGSWRGSGPQGSCAGHWSAQRG